MIRKPAECRRGERSVVSRLLVRRVSEEAARRRQEDPRAGLQPGIVHARDGPSHVPQHRRGDDAAARGVAGTVFDDADHGGETFCDDLNGGQSHTEPWKTLTTRFAALAR